MIRVTLGGLRCVGGLRCLGDRRCVGGLRWSHNFIIVEDMRKREYLGQLELMVLLAVIRPAKDAYGVLISREIAEKSGREVALASVYAALERLEKKGLGESHFGGAHGGTRGTSPHILQCHRSGLQGGARGT